MKKGTYQIWNISKKKDIKYSFKPIRHPKFNLLIFVSTRFFNNNMVDITWNYM